MSLPSPWREAAEALVRLPEAIRARVKVSGVLPLVLMVALAATTKADEANRPSPPKGSDTGAGEVFWSLKPPDRSAPPSVKHERAARNPIDKFILARLEESGLQMAPEADRATLIRRVTFDLTGLPPTPDEVSAFLRDRSPDAYEKVVDRLLASPRFGERWARHWLDVVRFAESHGFEMNNPRPNAWPYRDYVIRAFNQDLPYDRFVFEQLAGDTVGADEATGFLVGGPWDQVKSPDVQLTKQQRADELHDMVSTAGSTFLGLTVGCARCHDHKFDPISQKDYYSMQAFFAGVEHGERDWRQGDEANRTNEIESIRHELTALDEKLSKFEMPARWPVEPRDQSGALRPAVNALRNSDRFTPVVARFVRFTIEETTGAEPCIDELEVFTAGENPRNVALASAGAKVTVSSTLPNFPIHKIEHLNDGRYGNEWSWISNEPGHGQIQLELPVACTVDRVLWSRDRNGRFADRLATRYKIEVAAETNHWTTVASSADRAPYQPDAGPAPGFSAAGLPPEAAKELAALQNRRGDLENRLRELQARPMVYAGKFEKPPPSYRLHRGDPFQPREPVAPAGIKTVEPAFELPADTPDANRRVALAKWICDPRNPLAARVIVNRLWHYHFGRGIVNTPSDFGAMGDRPSHPELLDWLACELMSGGWRLKPIHRLIVLSAAYRQSSAGDARALQHDADNRLLWRFSPQRLEAEEIRDAILATTGKLDLRMGGPGFDVFQPNDNYVRVYVPKEEFGPAEWRRMIYQFKPRLQQDGVFGVFDCPDGAQIAPRRSSSITALQALNLLNSNFMLQQAAFFADRIGKTAGEDPEARVRCAFALAFAREPSRREIIESGRFIKSGGLTAFCRAIFNANEFVFVY